VKKIFGIVILIFFFAFILKQTNFNAVFSALGIFAKSLGQTIIGLLSGLEYFIISVL